MLNQLSKRTINIITILLSLAIGICLSALILFNLIGFYEQNPGRQITIFLIVSLVIAQLVFFSINVFILPFIAKFNAWKNLIFIASVTIVLILALSLGAKHYWDMPVVHKIEVCFDAEDGAGSVIIDEIIDPNTNRQYTPFAFGDSRYPLNLESGNCINGSLVNMISRSNQWWIVPRVRFLIKTTPPDGRFYTAINNVPSVVYFDKDAEEPFPGEVIIDEGFDQGSKITIPWHKAWFLALKAGMLFLSAIYLSFFFFGLTEQIITFSDDKSDPETGKSDVID
jgi:hypothetical protein